MSVYFPSSMFSVSHTGSDYYYLLTGAMSNVLALGTASVGTYTKTTVASGSATTLATATPSNLGSLTLGPGIWLLGGVVDYVLTGATTIGFKGGTSAVSVTFGAQDTSVNVPLIASVLTANYGQVLPRWVLDTRTMSGSTTVYLIGSGTFSLGTVAAFGTIDALKIG